MVIFARNNQNPGGFFRNCHHIQFGKCAGFVFSEDAGQKRFIQFDQFLLSFRSSSAVRIILQHKRKVAAGGLNLTILFIITGRIKAALTLDIAALPQLAFNPGQFLCLGEFCAECCQKVYSFSDIFAVTVTLFGEDQQTVSQGKKGIGLSL